MNHEIKTDMDSAWATAIALQAEKPLKNGDKVVIPGDPYIFWYCEQNRQTGKPFIFRQGLKEDEPAWVSKEVSPDDTIVTLSNISLAMALNTNRDIHQVTSVHEIISKLNKVKQD